MLKESRKLIELKKTIDIKIQSLVDKGEVSCRGSRASVHPHNFLINILPFWRDDKLEEIEDSVVDSRQILSGTYRDYRRVKVTKEYLEDVNRNSSFGHDKPSYHKVGPFPLYVAWEGKNRVQIFSEYGVDIICKETRTSYPKAKALKIHKARFRSDLYFLSCDEQQFVDDKDSLVQVPFPNFTLPLLRSYGVADGCAVFKPLFRNNDDSVFLDLTKCLMSN